MSQREQVAKLGLMLCILNSILGFFHHIRYNYFCKEKRVDFLGGLARAHFCFMKEAIDSLQTNGYVPIKPYLQ